MNRNRICLTIAAILLVAGPANAQATRSGAIVKSPAAGIGGGLVGGSGPTRDTCTESTPGNPEACDIDALTARCDAAGGGMSSLEGGGVDCDLGP